MVLAIAALVFHLNTIPAVVEPVAQVAPTTESAATTRLASRNKIVLATESMASEKQGDEKLLASATSVVSGESIKTQGMEDGVLSPASFSSVVKSSESLSAIRVGITDSKVRRFTSPQAPPSRREWLALAVAEHAAATFDAFSTRRAIGRGAVESDPLMRPFAQSPAIYAAIQVAPVALDFAARRMQRSPNRFLHNIWWVPQSAATGMFLFSGVHNLHVANSLR